MLLFTWIVFGQNLVGDRGGGGPLILDYATPMTKIFSNKRVPSFSRNGMAADGVWRLCWCNIEEPAKALV